MSGGLFPVFDLFIWYCWNYSNINLNRYSGQWWLRKLKAGDELKQCLIFIINLFNGSLWGAWTDRSTHQAAVKTKTCRIGTNTWTPLDSSVRWVGGTQRNQCWPMLSQHLGCPLLERVTQKYQKKWPKSNHDSVPTGLELNTFTVLRNTGAAWDSAQTPSVMWLVVVFVQRGGASASLWQQTTHR